MSDFSYRLQLFSRLIMDVTVFDHIRPTPKNMYDYTCAISNWNTPETVLCYRAKFKKLSKLFNKKYKVGKLEDDKLYEFLLFGKNEEYIRRYLSTVKLKYY